jgi:hypothetical protein
MLQADPESLVMAGTTAWAGGINNRANYRDIPDGYVRDMVNLDPLVGGTLGLRSGFDKVCPATNGRGALSVGSKILFADGGSLICFDTATNTQTVLGSIAGGGRLAGAVMNQELFFCTANDVLRFDGSTLRPWGVPTVVNQPYPGVGGGGIPAGLYQAAMTLVNAKGEEGGTVNPIQVTVPAKSSLQFSLSPPAGYTARLYVSTSSGESLYLQYQGSGGYTVSTIRDDTARLDTLNLREPVGGDYIAALGGILLIADGKTLWHTSPMSPHQLNMANSFFQYPSAISLVIQVNGGVFVCADKTYFLQSPESGDAVVQTTKLEYGAIPGTGTILPDGRASWMTQYGLAVGAVDGSVTLLSQGNFIPDMSTTGASGVIDHNGNQMVVTTMAGQRGPNPLAATDYYEAEIVTP